MEINSVTKDDLKGLYISPPESHKGQNGRLLIIGGSQLFHAASLWSLTIASRIVDLVHYCSVPENNDIVRKSKEEFRNGIVVARRDVEDYIREDDCILIGPGMVRSISNIKYQISNIHIKNQKLEDILNIEDEGVQTGALTNYLLAKYPGKQWVIDAGALQMVDVNLIPDHAILTPHQGEFDNLYIKYQKSNIPTSPFGFRGAGKYSNQISKIDEKVSEFSKYFNCITLLKGPTDIACSPDGCRVIEGGNAGMTKGGTGDVLAGLIAALACKNDPYRATLAGSYINKKAGEDLYEIVGLYFNSSDLANQIPVTMKRVLDMT